LYRDTSIARARRIYFAGKPDRCAAGITLVCYVIFRFVTDAVKTASQFMQVLADKTVVADLSAALDLRQSPWVRAKKHPAEERPSAA
jgi:hypothetical protein